MTVPGIAAAGVVLVLAGAARQVVAARRRAAVARRLGFGAVGAGGRDRRPLLGRQASHGLLDSALGVVGLPAVVERKLRAAAVPIDPGRAWLLWLGALGVGIPAAVRSAGPGLGIAALLVMVGGPLLALWAFGDRADHRLEGALPGVLESVAAGLRSGASLRQAVEEAAGEARGELGADLTALRSALRRGESLVDALDAWAVRRPLPGVRLAVAALALGAETGGAHARAVDGVAVTIRSRSAVAAEVRALSSQARLSGLVITLAPVAFGALAAVTNGRTAEFLFRTPVGVGCLVAGLALDGVAAVWMHRVAAVER